MGFIDRCAELGERRRGGIALQLPLLAFSAIFNALCLSYPLMLYYDFDLFEENIPLMESSVVVALWVLGASLITVDLRNFLNLFKIFGDGGKETWVVGFAVYAFFDMLGKIQSKILSKAGFMVIGLLVTQININFVDDGTGITTGAIVATVKVLTGYYFLDSAKTEYSQWALVLLLILACLVSKFTEAPHPHPHEEAHQS